MAIGSLTLSDLIKLNKLDFTFLIHQSNDMGNDFIIFEVHLRVVRGWSEAKLPFGSIYEKIIMGKVVAK